MIAENLEQIHRNISAAAARSGRSAEDIRLVCVSKNRTPEEISQAIACGVKDIGENWVQEAAEKYPQIAQPVCWHLVGHLQTNKVKAALGIFEMIHSLDSFKLAQEIDRRAKALGKDIEVLIEVNTTAETTKFGVSPCGLEQLVEKITPLKQLKLRGLMTMAPLTADPETTRPYFAALRQLRDNLKQSFGRRLDLSYLSMGMSQDYEIAVEEGANILRIGSAIFEG